MKLTEEKLEDMVEEVLDREYDAYPNMSFMLIIDYIGVVENVIRFHYSFELLEEN